MNSVRWLVVIILDIFIIPAVLFIGWNIFILANLYLSVAKGVEAELAGIAHFICPFYILFSLAAIWLLAKVRSKFLRAQLDSRSSFLFRASEYPELSSGMNEARKKRTTPRNSALPWAERLHLN